MNSTALPTQAVAALHKALHMRTAKAGGPKAFRDCIDMVAQLCSGKRAAAPLLHEATPA